jgi:hypothetical protein
VDVGKWRISTKSVVAALTTAGALWQIQPVRDFVMVQVHAHPHWAGAVAWVSGVWALLHNPEVQGVLGLTPGEQK